MPTVLTPDEIAALLTARPGWSLDHGSLRRDVTAASFPAAISLVVAVADLAEERDHHPDIDIRWRAVTFRLSTHSAGGITDLDAALAAAIDAAVDDVVASVAAPVVASVVAPVGDPVAAPVADPHP